nr:hypothetical protein [Tanacetum cinerariifolium]
MLVQATEATYDSPAIPEHTTVETPANMSPENKAYFQAEKEAIHLILTGIGDDIYSTVDACQTAQEMWEAIERLQQGESLNIQDVKTNLFWAFGEFTSHDGESMESYYTRFYKLMNEMIRNNLTVTRCRSTFNFFNNFSRNGQVNELRAEKLARNANPLALVATAQASQDQYYQTSRKPKRVKDFAYHKEKMLLYEEVDKQELEARYSYMAKIQEVPNADSGIDSEPVEHVQNDTGYNVFSNALQHSKQSESVSNTCLVEKDYSNVTPDSPDMCEDDIQNDQNDAESDDERVALANLIANLKLDVDENKKIQKQLKKANTTLAQELKE